MSRKTEIVLFLYSIVDFSAIAIFFLQGEPGAAGLPGAAGPQGSVGMPGERGGGGTPGTKGEKVSSGDIHLCILRTRTTVLAPGSHPACVLGTFVDEESNVFIHAFFTNRVRMDTEVPKAILEKMVPV